MSQYQKIMMGLGFVGISLLGILVLSSLHSKHGRNMQPMNGEEMMKDREESKMRNPKENIDLGHSVPKIGLVDKWEGYCKNIKGNYEVKYPTEWSLKMGDAMTGYKIIDDCSKLKLAENDSNEIFFSSLSIDETRTLSAGISIRVNPNTEFRTFEKIYKETTVGGKNMIWISKKYGEFFNGNTQYVIEVNDDVSEKTAEDFLSTFKFLK